jgi:hypothetical protein
MSAARFQPVVAWRVLIEHNVRFIVIGGLAGNAWGATWITHDLDICYDRRADNLTHLVAALKSLDVRLRGAPAGLPFILDEKTLKFGDTFTFDSNAGPLDCLGVPSGTKGYDDLFARSAEIVYEGIPLRFASVEDLIAMKRAANRGKDREHLEILESLRDELRRQS